MTENYLMSWEEIAKLLHKENESNPQRNVREWLARHGLKSFTKGYYVRGLVEKVLEEEEKKCLVQEKLANITTSGERLEWVSRQSRSKNTLQDLLNQKMQQAMCQS